MKYFLFTLALLFASANLVAETQSNVTIRSIGISTNVDSSITGNFTVVDKLTTNCPYEKIHFNINTDVGKAMYSTILTAKTTKKTLSQIDYFFSPGKRACLLRYVEIAD